MENSSKWLVLGWFLASFDNVLFGLGESLGIRFLAKSWVCLTLLIINLKYMKSGYDKLVCQI